MKKYVKKYTPGMLLVAALLALNVQPGFGVSKETIQMMTQLDTIQQQMMNLQNTVATQTAVLKTLVQQADQNITSMKATIAKMEEAEERHLASTSNQVDSLSSQVQQLSSSLDEAKGELSNLSSQLAQTQKMLQTINTAPNAGQQNQPAGAPGGAPGTAAQPGNDAPAPGAAGNAPASAAPVPDPQVLYQSAYTDYTQGEYELAIQGFQQYLHDYGNTDLASNAQFYIGDSEYLQKDYKDAIQAYDKCIQSHPNGNKAAAAYLKKGYALLALRQRTAAERDLEALIRKYPDSHERDLARERLRSLRAEARR